MIAATSDEFSTKRFNVYSNPCNKKYELAGDSGFRYDSAVNCGPRAEMGVNGLLKSKLIRGVWTAMKNQTSEFVRFGVASLAILLLIGGFSAVALAQTSSGTI